jgi:hypothetical protein
MGTSTPASTLPPTINQSERALKTLALIMLIGVVAILVYVIDTKSWAHSFTYLGTGVAVAAASMLVGGVLGFLFGIPRTSQQPAAAAPAPASTTPGVAAPANLATSREYQPNTNLEQISDWLTKILVGVGLIQVRAISDKLYSMAGGIAGALSDTPGNRSFALALVLFFAVAGFLLAYLWTRLYLPGAFRLADRDEIESLKAQVAQVDLRSRDTQATSLGTGKGDSDEVKKKLFEITDGIEPGNTNDPWKGRFGGQSTSNDRQLSAEVKPISGSSGMYSIRLTVSSVHPDTNPLKGAVQFFLHPTFSNSKPVVTVGPNGIAELNLRAWGAFTVGAVSDNGQTKLELDLAELENAPAEFRSR